MSASHRVVDVGMNLGPYRIIDRLGAGAAGSVFVAVEDDSGEKVALKVLRPGAELNEEIHSRFVREISVAQKLNDPHIISYRDCGVEDGVLYYAMEYVGWGSLADTLRSRGTLSWRDACECAIQICAGLKHLHDANIVHRDLKPANIFLSEDGRIRLGDFGLARDLDSHTLSLDGTSVGTTKYIAPEQAKGARKIDGRTDLYALGCNMFEFLTGRTPFGIESDESPVGIVEMMRRHVEEAPPKLLDVNPSLPTSLSDLVEQLLQKDPHNRPKSAAHTASALQRILDDPEAALDLSDSGILSSRRPDGPIAMDDEASLTARLRTSTVPANQISGRNLIAVVVVLAILGAVAAFMGN